jgi:hypothetical protein
MMKCDVARPARQSLREALKGHAMRVCEHTASISFDTGGQ